MKALLLFISILLLIQSVWLICLFPNPNDLHVVLFLLTTVSTACSLVIILVGFISEILKEL